MNHSDHVDDIDRTDKMAVFVLKLLQNRPTMDCDLPKFKFPANELIYLSRDQARKRQNRRSS